MSDATYYPPPAFAFGVAVASPRRQASKVDASFREVTGIDPKVDVEEIVEGGLNSYVHQAPGVTRHSNLVLKRGYVTLSSPLADWAAQVVGSSLGEVVTPQVLNVNLLAADGQPVVTWTFKNAWPVKWEVGAMDATRNEVLTETLEIAYSTVTRSLTAAAS